MFSIKNINLEEMNFSASKDTLYIIGNGFDLMHGAKSNYYCFRDSLGKNSQLRNVLEMYLRVNDDLWSDFENNLAYIDGNAMANTLEMWMDDFGAFEEDALAADYYLAIETAMLPANLIMTELPIAFRKWIESITVESSMPNMKGLLSVQGKYLNFNYTEFLETLYNVPLDNICYIHGNRKNKNGDLILGHTADIDNPYVDLDKIDALKFYIDDDKYIHDPSIELALDQIGWYDESTTKNSQQIIIDNQSFFDGLADINNIITIGHSLSVVDLPYFEEILKINDTASWFIGWHNSDDWERMKMFIDKVNLSADRVSAFRI